MSEKVIALFAPTKHLQTCRKKRLCSAQGKALSRMPCVTKGNFFLSC